MLEGTRSVRRALPLDACDRLCLAARVCYSRVRVSTVLDLGEGAIFAQQFKVIRPLAKGGMGAVYVVEQLGTKRERALKLMHPMLVADERSRDRFEREAQVSAKIDSDHVVEVIAAGVEPTTGTPWLCMELLKGEELGARMAKGPLRPDEVLEVVKQLGHALGAAHAAGIVHRDLKPENLFLATARREGIPFTLKVLDFGVAALVHEASGKSTATQGVGSPLWMAPEQTNVGNVRPATDVWALGLLAYHFLTGSFYWRSASTEGSTLTALLVEVMVEPLVPASQRAAEQGRAQMLPRGFDAWFARCVDRDPTKRFPEASAALTELVAVLGGNTLSMAPGTQPHAFAVTMAAPPTAPQGGATGPRAESPAASAFPATSPALMATGRQATTPNVAASVPVTPAVAPAPAPRSIWPWVLGLCAIALLVCGGGATYAVIQAGEAASAIAAGLPSPHVDVTSEDGTRVEIMDGRTIITLADGGVIGAAAPTPSAGSEAASDGPSEPAAAAEAGADTEADTEAAATTDDVEPPTITGSVVEDEPARPRRPRGPRVSTSPVARQLRARLSRCVEGNIAGEPRAPWTFTLRFNHFGMANGARIEGPSADLGAGYRIFRGCVQADIAGFDSGGDPGPFTLMLP